MKKIIASIMVASIALGTLTTLTPQIVHAAEVSNDFENSTISLPYAKSKPIEDIADSYIHFNEKTNQFILDEDISEKLNLLEITQIQNQISETNRSLQTTIQNSNGSLSLQAATNDGTTYYLTPESRAAGKNGLEFHWNFVRIFLNAKTTNSVISGSLSVLSTVLAEIPGVGLAATVAASFILGAIGSSSVDDGIWFDYNYFIGVLTANWGWQ